jgi:transcriptional regulator with XRE-family HTH domain
VELVDERNETQPVGQVLRALRTEKSLTQQQVGQLAKVDTGTICRIERSPAGRRMPAATARYAAVFGLELVESFTYSLRPIPRRGGRVKAA